jgi:hypothetical protein
MMASMVSRRNRVLLFLVSILALLPLACNSPAAQPTQAPPAQPTAATTAPAPTTAPAAKDTATPAASGQSAKPTAGQPTVTGAAATPTAKPSGLAGALGQFASPDALNSYRSKMSMGEVKADGSKSPLTSWTMEWTKEGPSTHMVMGMGAGSIETIAIGNKTWMNLMGGWIEAPASTTTKTEATQSPDSFLPQQDFSVKQVGTETVNGIPCKKFTYTGKLTMDLSETGQPANKVTWEMTGEMWVADKVGLPAVAVKQTAQWKGALLAGLLGTATPGTGTPGAADQVTSYMEMELSDLNAAITIKAPQGASQMPAIPGLPGGIPGMMTPGVMPTRPPTGAATPAPQVSLDTCWDVVPDPSNADTADAVTQRLATALAMAAAPGKTTVMQSYVTDDALADVKAYYVQELPAWEWTQIGSGPLAPGGWDTSWQQANFVLRVLLLAPTQADPATKIIVVCAFAK